MMIGFGSASINLREVMLGIKRYMTPLITVPSEDARYHRNCVLESGLFVHLGSVYTDAHSWRVEVKDQKGSHEEK
jgi:hypothetical protein